MNNKTLTVWFCVDKRNKVQMFLDEEPKKNVALGRFEGKYPFINSLEYQEICNIVKMSKMTFENKPECLPIEIQY